MPVKMSTTEIEREVIVREKVKLLHVQYDHYRYYGRDPEPDGVEDVAKDDDDEWWTLDGGEVWIGVSQQGEEGKHVGVYSEASGTEALFRFSQDAAENFLNLKAGESARATVESRRILRLHATGKFLYGQAPCGAYWRISRADGKKIGRTVLKEWYSDAQ